MVESHTSIVISSERDAINSVVCWTAFHSRVYVRIFVKDPKQHRLGREGGGSMHRHGGPLWKHFQFDGLRFGSNHPTHYLW